MRLLHDHKINPFNDDCILIEVLDEPDENAGNACNKYGIWVNSPGATRSTETPPDVIISFQHGPVKEAGANGITDQALLAIVLDRWRSFQKSKWANRETALSITKLEEALMWQHKRTIDRMNRNVEGTNEL